MDDVVLPQSETGPLLAAPKRRVDDEQYTFPSAGEHVSVPLVSADGRQRFFLDVNRGRIN